MPGGAERRRRRGGRPSRGLPYFVAEGLAGFRHNGLMSLASVTITVVTLLALGAALVMASVLDHIARHLEHQVQVVVYVRDGVEGSALAAVRDRLARLPGVVGLTYVSKAQALARFRQTMGGQLDLQDLLAHNPLPASFVIAADRPEDAEAIAGAARGLPGVEDASYGLQAVGRLLALTRMVRLLGAAAGGLLALVALIVIASTIRLTVFARRAEVEVMRLVGATAWFIRWPFVIEGTITGALGAGAAVVLVAGAYAVIARGAARSLPFLPLPDPGQVALAVFWKLLLWGITMGSVGSLLALRRHLRV